MMSGDEVVSFWFGILLGCVISVFATYKYTNSNWDNYLINNNLAHYDSKSADLVLDKTGEQVYK